MRARNHVSALPATSQTRPVLTLNDVIAALYVGAPDPSYWDQIGAEQMARYVLAVATDPACRLDDLTTVVTAARGTVQAPELAAYMAQCVAFAPAVLDALDRL